MPTRPLSHIINSILWPALIVWIMAFMALSAAAQTTRPTLQYVGIYSQPAASLAKWRERGMTLAMHWESESGKVTQAQWRAAARAAGLVYIDTYLADADVDDPHLVGWILKDSDEWNRARGNPATRPAVAPFIAEAQKLTALNKTRGASKWIVANADGPGVTTAMWEKPPYPGIANNEKALLPHLTARSWDWYPVVNTAANTPEQIARRPMYLPAQAGWRIRTWCEAWGAPAARQIAIVEAAKGWRAPLGVTGAQMIEQAEYLMGDRPFPVPDANARPVQYQGQLADALIFWTANGQDGPGWRWDVCTDDQLAAMKTITNRYAAPATQPTSQQPTLADMIRRLDAIDAVLRDIRDRQDRPLKP